MAVGWGKRIEQGLLLYASRHGRTTLERWGELVAAAEGREAAYKKGSVSAWISEDNEPKFATVEAMARLLGCAPEWIVWGRGQPPLNPALDASQPIPRRGPKQGRGRP